MTAMTERFRTWLACVVGWDFVPIRFINSTPVGTEPHPTRYTRVACATLLLVLSQVSFAADKPTLKVPPGFEVVLFADDDLAHDIQCLTVDARGRITVAGNGEIKFLIDTDGDGIADRAELFATGPSSGVQGMYWHGPELLAVGGDGLTLYRAWP